MQMELFRKLEWYAEVDIHGHMHTIRVWADDYNGAIAKVYDICARYHGEFEPIIAYLGEA